MSRTIRRKTIKVQNGWKREWTRAFGYNWEWDGHPDYTSAEGKIWHDSYFIRQCTAREVYERWNALHGESRHCNHRSPSRYYRWLREEELRTHNKRELFKELNRDDYEGMYWRQPLDCWWDWS